MNDDLTGMFRELKEIEAAISQSREMVEVIQKHLEILPPEFLRDVQKVIAPLDVKKQPGEFVVWDRVIHQDDGHHGEVRAVFTPQEGPAVLTVLWDTGIVEKNVSPNELRHERERDQP